MVIITQNLEKHARSIADKYPQYQIERFLCLLLLEYQIKSPCTETQFLNTLNKQ